LTNFSRDSSLVKKLVLINDSVLFKLNIDNGA
jgi:hypothetical protein